MGNFKYILYQLLAFLAFDLALAQEVHNVVSCYEKTEREYSYQTEILLHAYEQVKVSPREFETLRTELITRRESDISTCEQNDLEEMDKFVENLRTSIVIQDASAGRGIASVGGRLPTSVESATNSPIEAYTEVDCSGAAYDEFIPEYDGERVRVGN